MLSRFSRCLARLSAGFCLGFLAFPALAEDLPQGLTKGPSVEGVTQYTLQNGLRILLAPDDSKPTTTVNMTYLVGARQENYGQTGMAHLLEHMLFRGTPTTRNALAEFSRRGLAANGTTNSDRTNYFASFAANAETLDWFLGWQADAMVNSLISKEDLDSEMTVVRNEMERGENSPFQVLLQKMRATAYQWHNYGHDTIGARSDVENVDVGQLRQFYHQYYQPDNAVLIVSGRFDPQATLDVISRAFGKIPRPERKLPPEYTVEPVQDGERSVTLRRHGGSPLIASLFHIPAAASADYTALEIGTSILSDTPSGRLYHALVANGLASSVFGFTAGLRQPGYAFFGAELESGMDQAKALKVMNDTLADVGKNPFTQEELDRMRNRWLTDWNQVYADPGSLASALSDTAADGDWRLFFLQRDRVENLKLEDVQRATTQYLVASNRTDGSYVPTESPKRAPLPPAVDLAQIFKDYHGKSENQVVEAFDPSPDHINAATRRKDLELPNGKVQLALLAKPTRGNRVQATLLVQFGTADELKGKREISAAVASLLDHGTKTLTRQQIQDKFNALQADVDFSGGAGVVAVHMSTIDKNLPPVVDLVVQVLREANFPEKELQEYQRQANTSIKNAMSEPSALASRALARHDNPWPRDDVRYVPTFEEAAQDIAAIKQQDLVAFHSHFYGAGTIRFAAVGAFDPDAVTASITKGVEGWQKAPAYVRVSDPYRPVPPKEFDIDTPDKANAFFLSTMPLKMQDTDADYPALYLSNYLLGGSETSRLWNRVRVQGGLSYDVRSQLDISSYEPSGDWTIYAIQAPENAEKVHTVVEEELQKALKDGFSKDEVQEGVTSLLNYRKLARTRDGVLASAWINYLQQDRDFTWSKKIDEALSALDADKVNAAFRKALDPDAFSTAIAADEKKVKPGDEAAEKKL